MSVYFIKPIDLDGPIKIGCSRSPDTRRETLDNWSPFALEIVAEIEGGYALERRFHAYLADSHERREWFTATPLVVETMQAVAAGTFDLSLLPSDPRKRAEPKTPFGRRCSEIRQQVTAMRAASGYFWDGHVGRAAHGQEPDATSLRNYLTAPHKHGQKGFGLLEEHVQAEWLQRLHAQADL